MCVASSSDGTHLAAGIYFDGGIYASTNAGLSWTQTSAPTNAEWGSIASSSDGTKLAAVVEGGGIWTAHATIETTNTSLTDIVVTPANLVIVTGSNLTFTATGNFSDGSDTNLSSANGIVWSSSDPTVASIDTNGLATGLSAGTTTISATYSNLVGDTVLTVVSPPTISTNPISTTVSPGGSVTLRASASGGDLSYQWAFNGTNITDATNATLIITNLSSANVGSYTVTVSNLGGSVTSQAASVASATIEMFQGVITWSTMTNWTQTTAPNGLGWWSMASSDDGTKLAAGVYNGGIYTSTNAGATWIQSSAPDEYWESIASSSDGTKQAAVVDGGGIWTSTNAGGTWTQTSASNESWYCIASSSDGTKLAAVVWKGGGIYTSTNGGGTWTQTSAPAEFWESIASSSDGTRLAAVVLDGGIWTSTNTGATWTQTGAPNELWYSIASSSDGAELAAVVDGGGIYTSTNAGVIWTQTSAPSESWYSIASSSDGTKLAAFVVDVGIWTSVNAGVTWIQTSAPAKNWLSIASSSDGIKLTAVAYESGIWTARATILPTAGTFAGVVVDGPHGSNYLIQAASNMTVNWTTLTNLALPSQPYLYIDDHSATNSQQFYRAVLAQ